MDSFMISLKELVFWHWFILLGIFLVLELMVPGFFFIWLAAAAGTVGALMFFMPDMGWEAQFIVFALISIVSVSAFRIWQRKHPTVSDDPLLNNRGAQYIGRVLVLDEELTNGRGRARLDDTVWQVRSSDGEDLPAGSKVRVSGVEGASLVVNSAT